MKFIVECDGADGLVLMDKSYIREMNEELLGSMDFLLDYYGETELKFDFPEEEWKIVRERESNLVRNFCNSGKMIIHLYKDGDQECEFEMSDNIENISNCLYLPTGNLLAVTASELIQCALYPDMDMEKLFELKVKNGWYGILADNSKFICALKSLPIPPFSNINEY